MHRTSFVTRLIGWSSIFAMLIFCFSSSAARAQQPLQPVNFAQPEIQQNATTIQMVVGTSQTYMMTTKTELKKVENQNAKVLDVKPLKSANEVQLIAVGPGRTTVKFTDMKDRVELLEVIVISDRVKEMRDLIARALPTASITVASTDSGATVILTGYVLTADDLRVLQQIASGGGIINNVRVGGVQTVQLEVIVALVNRTEGRNMSFSWSANGSNWFAAGLFTSPLGLANGIATAPSGATAALTSSGGNLPFGILNSNGSFQGYLNALRNERLFKIMAEPRVTTLSGRPAYIVSGGETPILTSSGQGAPSVSYKQFGTVVHFLPVVLGNGKIHLEVRPEISEPDPTLDVTIAGIVPTKVPGFRTRSAQATVQIEDGQTLAIGGLIQTVVRGQIDRIPVLGDLPYVGMAFTSKSFIEEEQELVILVTPRLVDPVDCTKIPKYLPGRESRSPDDFELFLEGIMEAPRGPRHVLDDRLKYRPAFHNAPNYGQMPCYPPRPYSQGQGSVGSNTGIPVSRGPAVDGAQSLPMAAPSFPESQVMPALNSRVVSETITPVPISLPPLPSMPDLGPLTPTSIPPATSLPQGPGIFPNLP